MKIIAKLVIVALFILVLSQSALIPGIVVDSFSVALIAAVILGLVNVLIKPILVFFTLPITLLSLGTFIFIINALLFWLVSVLVPGFGVDGFVSAFLGALLVSVVQWLLDRFL